MKKTLLFALPMLAAAPLLAHDGPHGGPGMAPPARAVDMSKITGGDYVVEGTHTLVGWRVSHFGINDYFGIFGNPTGTLKLDKANPAKSSVVIDIPVKELYTASARLTGHLMSKDFFNAEVHPSAKFVSTQVVVTGTNATINGNLTLLGVTKPVMLMARLSGAGANMMTKRETIGFHARGKISRSAFGMTYGVPGVSDNVELDITVAFEKQ